MLVSSFDNGVELDGLEFRCTRPIEGVLARLKADASSLVPGSTVNDAVAT